MPATALAAPITYDFTGTLTRLVGAEDQVTGQFTFDAATGELSAFAFSTPYGAITDANSNAEVEEIQADSPELPFMSFHFRRSDGDGHHVWLLFQSTMAEFSGGALYTSPVRIGSGVGSANVGCASGMCTGSSYLSGEATPVEEPVPTPEPEPMPEPTLAGLLTLGAAAAVVRRRLH